MPKEEDEGFTVGKVLCFFQTANAIKCRMLDSACNIDEGEVFWIPQSNIHDNSDVFEKDQEGNLTVKTYWAEKEGWSDK